MVISLNVYSQTNTDNYKDILDSAVVIKLNEAYEHYNEELKKDIKTENWKSYISKYKNRLENIYLLDSNHNSFHLNRDKSTSDSFKNINLYDKKNKKLLREGINAWKISSTLNKNRLTVSIIDFIITFKDGKYNFANGGGSTIVFEYNCNKMSWEFLSNNTHVI